jgi:cytochrome c biogenesis protein CcmG, thiol:disulfide interchange protein DsbE
LAASTPTLGSSPGTLARIGLAGVSVVALIAFALYAAVLASRVDELEVGDPVPVTVPGGAAVGGPFGTGVVAPDFELQTVDGQTVRLSDFAGRPVWINVWASWCAPCRAEMPDIEQVYRELPGATPGGAPDAAGKGPVLLLVSLGEDPADVRRYLESTRYQLPILVDPDFSFTRSYRITGLPTHFFIDAEGKLREIAIGGLKPNGMRARLAKVTSQ